MMSVQPYKIEVSSVSEFLNALKNIYCDKDHQLFYRGVSKEQYATPENDHPSIFRKKDYSDSNSEKWVVDEDRMFYDLVARCPEYFKDCKTTFEHLVMMQHYSYPTRLLDITSNPLVALYFACGGLNGANKEDGQLISYQIQKNDIRNYESDRVSLLSNLSLADVSLQYISFFGMLFKRFISANQLYLERLYDVLIGRKLEYGEVISRSEDDYVYLILKSLLGNKEVENDVEIYRKHETYFEEHTDVLIKPLYIVVRSYYSLLELNDKENASMYSLVYAHQTFFT